MESITTEPIFTPTPTPSSNIWENFRSISWSIWAILILLLSLLGFNVFTYLAQGTHKTGEIFGYLFKNLFGSALKTTKQTVEMSKEGVDAIADTTVETIDVVQGKGANGSVPGAPTSVIGGPERPQADPIAQALQGPSYGGEPEPEAATGGSGGWCYIGEDQNNARTCASVGVNDTCMSGDIFPSQAICVNPELRP
jgi:hypothetical protein